MDSYERINDALVNLFRDVLAQEERAMTRSEFRDLSMNDWHVIEAVGPDSQKSMSQVAKELSVTHGTLTIAMNGLCSKGYVKRRRGTEDRRIVYISLTEKGEMAYREHEAFHREMIEAVIRDQTPEEITTLASSLTKLKNFFLSFKV